MKTLITILSILLISCSNRYETNTSPSQDILVADNISYSLRIVTIQDHQYILYSGTHGGSIIHSSSCKNTNH